MKTIKKGVLWLFSALLSIRYGVLVKGLLKAFAFATLFTVFTLSRGGISAEVTGEFITGLSSFIIASTLAFFVLYIFCMFIHDMFEDHPCKRVLLDYENFWDMKVIFGIGKYFSE